MWLGASSSISYPDYVDLRDQNHTFDGLIDQDRMARPPKGYSSELPHIEYIKNRHFLCETSINLNKRVPKDLAGEIAKNFDAAKPLVVWLRNAVK